MMAEAEILLGSAESAAQPHCRSVFPYVCHEMVRQNETHAVFSWRQPLEGIRAVVVCPCLGNQDEPIGDTLFEHDEPISDL
jgi:hypothetical protein